MKHNNIALLDTDAVQVELLESQLRENLALQPSAL